MDRSFAQVLAVHYRRMHDRILVLIDDLSDEQLAWRPAPTGRSIAWNVEHLARSGRRLGANAPSMAPGPGRPGEPGQPAEATSKAWHGYDGAGDGVAGGEAYQAAEPGKEGLLDAARQAFATVERLVADAAGARPPTRARADRDVGGRASEEIGDALVEHLAHAYRHVGEMECLRGLQAVCGSPPAHATTRTDFETTDQGRERCRP